MSIIQITPSISVEIEDEKRAPIFRAEKGKSLIDFPSDYTVIDLETTGLDTRYNEIIEIAAIRIRNNAVADTFSTLVKPTEEISEFISDLTGITNEMVSAAPDIKTALPDFVSFISDDILVGHNVNFDYNFLYDNLMSCGFAPLKNDFVDTMRISRILYPDFKHHRLGDLVTNLLQAEFAAHRSADDCNSTFLCFEKMRDETMSRYGNISEFTNIHKNKQNGYTYDISAIKATVGEIDPSNPFYGKVCVFTGTLERMVRKDAAQCVVNKGGICDASVTAKTNYLILGNNDYCKTIKDGKSNKQKKAEKMKLDGFDIEILSENVFYDMLTE